MRPLANRLRSACRVAVAACCVLVAATGPAVAADAPPASTAPVPAGDYTLDKAHASLVFRVDHLGFSLFTGRFSRFDARLAFDPKRLASTRLEASVDTASIESDNAPAGFLDSLKGPQWFDSARHPQMTFRSTAVSAQGRMLRLRGDLTLHGVTRPVTLVGSFNGGYAGHPMDPAARIGFSARGMLQRSAFGIAYGIPAPGTTMGVADTVEIVIEAEFTGPPLPGAAAAASTPASAARK